MKTLTIATRQSPLALWQANDVATRLQALNANYNIKLLPMITSGDKAGPQGWQQPSGKGLFVKELEEALLSHKADLAVHSMKDLPAIFPTGLGLGAICPRANPFDAFVSQHYPSLETLPQRAKIGTASLRRQSQLRHYRADLQLQTLRGNVQTRLKKMEEEGLDAIILAVAGLERLGLHDRIRAQFTPDIMLPACGQGALGVECRMDDKPLLDLLAKLNCSDSALCVNTERLVNAKLGGNCHVPIAIYCTMPAPQTLHLRARVLSANGQHCIEAEAKGPAHTSASLAEACTADLLKRGARELLEA